MLAIYFPACKVIFTHNTFLYFERLICCTKHLLILMRLALQGSKCFWRSTNDATLSVAASNVRHWLILTDWLYNSLATELSFWCLNPFTIQITRKTYWTSCLIALVYTAIVWSLTKSRISIYPLLFVDFFNRCFTFDFISSFRCITVN